jgi:hypothetical protein
MKLRHVLADLPHISANCILQNCIVQERQWPGMEGQSKKPCRTYVQCQRMTIHSRPLLKLAKKVPIESE